MKCVALPTAQLVLLCGCPLDTAHWGAGATTPLSAWDCPGAAHYFSPNAKWKIKASFPPFYLPLSVAIIPHICPFLPLLFVHLSVSRPIPMLMARLCALLPEMVTSPLPSSLQEQSQNSSLSTETGHHFISGLEWEIGAWDERTE